MRESKVAVRIFHHVLGLVLVDLKTATIIFPRSIASALAALSPAAFDYVFAEGSRLAVLYKKGVAASVSQPASHQCFLGGGCSLSFASL